MEPKNDQGNFMEKIAQFIVDKRNLFFFIYAAATASAIAFAPSLFGWIPSASNHSG